MAAAPLPTPSETTAGPAETVLVGTAVSIRQRRLAGIWRRIPSRFP
jgi:hypothetical protein